MYGMLMTFVVLLCVGGNSVGSVWNMYPIHMNAQYTTPCAGSQQWILHYDYMRVPESINKWAYLFYMAVEYIRSILFFVDAILIYERMGPCTELIFNTPDAIHNNAI